MYLIWYKHDITQLSTIVFHSSTVVPFRPNTLAFLHLYPFPLYSLLVHTLWYSWYCSTFFISQMPMSTLPLTAIMFASTVPSIPYQFSSSCTVNLTIVALLSIDILYLHVYLSGGTDLAVAHFTQ